MTKVAGSLYKRGDQYVWRYRSLTNGVQVDRRVTLGSNLERAMTEAKRLNEQAEAEARGETIRRDATVQEFCKEFIARCRERGHWGWSNVDRHLRMFSEHVGPGRLMRRLTRQDVTGFVAVRQRTVRPATVHAAVRDVKRLLSAALEVGVVDHNVAAGVKVSLGRPLPVRLPTEAELARLIVYLQSRKPWLHRLLILLLGTGARLSEGLRATWGDYDPTGARLVLARRKVDDLLDIPLVEPLRGVLWTAWASLGMPTSGNIIVGEKGQPVTRNGARSEFRKAARALGMGWMKLATCRKWAGTEADRGAGIVSASRLLGHTTTRVTEGYLRGGEIAARQRAVDAVGEALGRAVGNGNSADPEPGRDSDSVPALGRKTGTE